MPRAASAACHVSCHVPACHTAQAPRLVPIMRLLFSMCSIGALEVNDFGFRSRSSNRRDSRGRRTGLWVTRA